MIDEARLRKCLRIDKLCLDDAIIENPQLILEVGDAHADAVGIRDTLKEQLAVIDAEIDGEMRLDAGSKRITDTTVKAMILTDSRHDKAFRAYIQARIKADKLAALKAAFDDRRDALRDLAKLYVANYFDHSSIQGTSSEDKTVYDTRRRNMAEARGRRTEK
jgi:hypothetical protein